MSERGNFRAGRTSGRGDSRPGRGGGTGRGGPQAAEKPKKENILDLTKYMDKEIIVKFNGAREVVGTLKGYDQLMNLVLDDVKETLRGPKNPALRLRLAVVADGEADDEGNTSTRSLGLIVARGTLLVMIAPVDGSEHIENPFNNNDE